MAEQLKKKDYYTAHIGKWHLGRADGLNPNDKGFDDSLLMYNFGYLPENHPDVVNSNNKHDPYSSFARVSSQKAEVKFNKGEVFEAGGYVTDYYTDQAIQVIDKNKNRPFFLFMSHMAAHFHWQATRADYDSLAHIKDHNLRVYASMIKAVDRSTGRILSALEKNGLTNNTLVIFTSDNGAAHNAGNKESNKPFRGWKATNFEGGTRVPFMAKWPKQIPSSSIYEGTVSLLDVFPTVSAAAGVPLPKDRVMDGVDLIPFVRGELTGIPHETLYWRTGDVHAIIHEGWKLQKYSNRSLFLFHLAKDPTEQINLAEERPDKIAELEQKFAKHNSTQVNPRWPILIKVPVAIDYTFDEDYTIENVVFYPN